MLEFVFRPDRVGRVPHPILTNPDQMLHADRVMVPGGRAPRESVAKQIAEARAEAKKLFPNKTLPEIKTK